MRACAPTDLGGSLGGTMPLDHLWATWRSAYVSKLADSRLLPSEGEAAGRSLFERILAGADEEGDEAAGIVHRGATCFALLHLFPNPSRPPIRRPPPPAPRPAETRNAPPTGRQQPPR